MTQILVTGGAGYIGAHVVRALVAAGADVVVLDDLSTGHRDAVDPAAELFVADVGDRQTLDRLFAGRDVDAVIHLAGPSLVAESMRDQGRYERGIAGATRTLLEAMAGAGVRRMVFSSSAAVYGDPRALPIVEEHPRSPRSPYGRAKLDVEEQLDALGARGAIDAVSLRYFNAAGASPAGDLGERHDPETHLIPILLEVVEGARPSASIFGTDYPTADGTCVRDYVHVDDIAAAHLLAMRWLDQGATGHRALNLGSERGASVREVIAAVERVTGAAIPVVEAPRRPGDPPSLIAAAAAARATLGWSPRYPELETIVAHAWAARERAR